MHPSSSDANENVRHAVISNPPKSRCSHVSYFFTSRNDIKMSNIKIRRPLTRVKNLYSCDEEQANCANIDGKKG